MKALVLAGGRGTRLRPITNTINKHLIPIAGRPMIFRVIDDIAACGITEVIVNLNKGDKEVPAAIGDGSAWGITITYIEQEIPNGMMYPILLAEELLGNEPFLLYGGDNILSGGIKAHYDTFLASDAAAHLLVTRVKNPERFGVAVVEEGRVVRTVEKPQEFVSNLAVTAVYFYRPPIFDAMKNVKPEIKGNSTIAEYYPPLAHQWLIDQGHKITVGEVTGWWKDTGKPEDLLEGNSLVLHGIESLIEGTVDDAAVIQGKVCIGAGTVVGPRVKIRGPVTVGKNCVLNNCYLGPYTSIGDNVTIDGGEIEHSIIMRGVTIKTNKRIVESILGENCTVGCVSDRLPNGHKLIIGDHTAVEL
ncbi:MAG: glucose-1-phosphate thymidylyltransferase [Parcubacteria group bacterium]|nr:glucose-1-phosphate thymidylyltransferase [Parcubacteria group bacterium]